MSSDEDTKKRSRCPMDLTWKDSEELKRYVTETGKILPRKFTRLNAREQRHIQRQIKRGRNMLVMK